MTTLEFKNLIISKLTSEAQEVSSRCDEMQANITSAAKKNRLKMLEEMEGLLNDNVVIVLTLNDVIFKIKSLYNEQVD